MTFTTVHELAPWPTTDKYPVVIGPGLSLQYISTIFRLSLQGLRQQYVDLLDELLDKDLHAYSIISKRVTAIATGVVQLTPSDGGSALSEEIASFCQKAINAIPDLMQQLAQLSWATFYAVVGNEIHWGRDGRTWFPERLSFIHSRRLSFPAPSSWDLYLWDQGATLPNGPSLSRPLVRTKPQSYGLRIADFPGKFIIHAPQIRGNYPTREGLGRQLAYWLALKLAASRNAPRYLEQFARPVPVASYASGPSDKPRKASGEDIADAKAALKAMGAGALASWLHSDAITLDKNVFDTGTAKITFKEWIDICNAEMSKAVLGGTLSTEVGSTGGNRALGQEQGKGEGRLLQFDAALLAGTIKRDLIGPLVRLNFPNASALDMPNVKLHFEGDPDPELILDRAKKATDMGAVVDHDATMEAAGIKVIPEGEVGKRRRLIAVQPTKSLETYDPDLVARAAATKDEREKLAPPLPQGTQPDAEGDGSDDDQEPGKSPASSKPTNDDDEADPEKPAS